MMGADCTVWVCVDCYLAVAGISEAERGEAYPTDPAPWSKLSELDAVPGMLDEDHAPDCDPLVRSEQGCECGTDAFSMTPCDACGSALAGQREACVIWIDA